MTECARNVALCLSLVIVVGCGDGRPERVPVAGQVLIDGEPLTYGNVMFVPEGGRPSGANLQPDGRFVLSCFDSDDGVIVGTHRVAVSSKKLITLNQVEWYAPQKYSNYNTSGLTFEITEPTDSLVINLTWDGKKPRGR